MAMRSLVITFIFGAAIAGGAVFWFLADESERMLPVFARQPYVRAYERAMEAYQHEDPTIAIWELRHLIDTQMSLLHQERIYSNELRSSLVMTRARLAKLYHEQGREPEAVTNANLAITLLLELSGTNGNVTNLETLLEHLRHADDQVKKYPRYE